MKKLIRCLLCTIMIIFVFSVTGCSDKGKVNEAEETKKPAVAYMVAHTANAKWIDSSVPMVQDTMIDCAENYGHAFIVRVDGEPELVLGESLDIDDQFKNASQERLTRDAYNKATNILAVLDGVSASHPEVDYLEGLRCAAASLQSLDESYTSRTIICCGTGAGTSGYLNLNNNILSADSEAIVEMLVEREALPDLKNITVYWIGMGQTIQPQEKLTPKQVKNLQEIWEAVVIACGGEFVANDYITVENDMEVCNELPHVSVVDLPSDMPIIFEPEVLENETAMAFQEPMMLGQSQVEFVAGEANYLNPEAATEIIRPIAEYLIEQEDVNLLLIGSTAGDITDESTLQLSKERGEAVENTLIQLGVAEDRVTSIGMGADDPWHKPGQGYEGPIASSNRKVVLIDIETDEAQKILQNQ